MKKLTLLILFSFTTALFAKGPIPPEKKICFVLYTVQNHILKMTVQLYPLSKTESRDVYLEIKKGNKWTRIAACKVREKPYTRPKNAKSWTAHFRVEKWDPTQTYEYRVNALDGVATYTGIIRKDPIQKDEIVVAAFTGNSNRDKSPRTDIIKNIKIIDPDLLFFSGDQVYDHKNHLRSWLDFGRQFGEITRDRPTIFIPDDHDIGQSNVWGANGKKSHEKYSNDGGYNWSPQYVNEVQWAQTSNLPDPYDPTPVKQGITVYYTSLNVGGIDFAIIEDRKFKTGPRDLVPKSFKRVDHVNDPNFDTRKLDFKGAVLLGKRQLKFLHEWSQNWKNAEMKCVLSATIFANAEHLDGGSRERIYGDLDSNGWPQSGRNRALKEIRKGFSFMIAGDQHLATVIHHGIDDFGDSGYSFCVPSIINYHTRIWAPLEKPIHPLKTPLKHTGDYFDSMHNRITMCAYANPYEHNKITASKYVKKAAGFGIIRFNKKKRTIKIECWPRGADLSDPNAKQYPGWPITIHQMDNYGRKAVAYLPIIQAVGKPDPVIQILQEPNNEVVYTIRIKGNTFRPKVFKKGTYTIKVGEGKNAVVLKHVQSMPPSQKKTIRVQSK